MILERDNSVLRPWSKELGIKDAEMSKFEQGENRERLLVSWFRGKEWRTRDLVHKYWHMPLGEDLSVLAKIRNCLVHQFGEDADGEIAHLLNYNSRIYAKVENGQVYVGFDGAYEAVGLIISDLSIVDQCLGRYFGLLTSPFEQPNLRRVYSYA